MASYGSHTENYKNVFLEGQWNLCRYSLGSGVSERRWHLCCCLVCVELRPQVHLFPELTAEGTLPSEPACKFIHRQTDKQRQPASTKTFLLVKFFSYLTERLRTEGGKVVIIGYIWLKLAWLVNNRLCAFLYITWTPGLWVCCFQGHQSQVALLDGWTPSGFVPWTQCHLSVIQQTVF